MFGVERRLALFRIISDFTLANHYSTVSKVLRQKEKYLQKPNEIVRSPERRSKGKSPDIERTLANWVIKEQKKGSVLSDEAIRDKAQYFSSVSGPDNVAPNPANNAAWLKNFRRKHDILGRKSSKDHSSTDDSGSPPKAKQNRRSPEDASPMSPNGETTSPSPRNLRGMRSHESVKMESPEGFSELTKTLSANSLSSAFADTPTSCFSPSSLLSPSSPFFTPDSASVPMSSFFQHSDRVSSPGGNNFQRPRSSTFPMIYQDITTSDGPADGTQFLSDAPMDDIDHSLASIDEAMDDSSSTDTDMDNMQQPQTMSPAGLMQPPPLPAMVSSQKGASSPSQEEARRALQVLWQYFANQPRGAGGNLNMEETLMMGKFMERLDERNKDRGGI